MEKDIDNFTEDLTCPYCGGESFENEAIELSIGEFLNTCVDCGNQSIYFEDKQYKVKVVE